MSADRRNAAFPGQAVTSSGKLTPRRLPTPIILTIVSGRVKANYLASGDPASRLIRSLRSGKKSLDSGHDWAECPDQSPQSTRLNQSAGNASSR